MSRFNFNMKIALTILVLLALFISIPAHAELSSAGVMDSVLQKYYDTTQEWASYIKDAATRLFWTLALISMVWTFGMMLLRRADFGEFFAEFVRFIVFTGFFLWILTNGAKIVSAIFDSFRQIAGVAPELSTKLQPSLIVDIGFALYYRVLDQSVLWSPVDNAIGITLACVILVILALVSINIVILLCSIWVLGYAGIFYLGFGGSRWTADFAITYYRNVIGVGAQLMIMILITSIGATVLYQFNGQMSQGVSLKEMGVMLVVAVLLLSLVRTVPKMFSGIITDTIISVVDMTTVSTSAPSPPTAVHPTPASYTIMDSYSRANQSMAGNVAMNVGIKNPVESSFNEISRSVSSSVGNTPFAQAGGYGSDMSYGSIARSTSMMQNSMMARGSYSSTNESNKFDE